jgi:hypothetical protein
MNPKNINIKAVAAGLLTDITGSTAVGFAIAEVTTVSGLHL